MKKINVQQIQYSDIIDKYPQYNIFKSYSPDTLNLVKFSLYKNKIEFFYNNGKSSPVFFLYLGTEDNKTGAFLTYTNKHVIGYCIYKKEDIPNYIEPFTCKKLKKELMIHFIENLRFNDSYDPSRFKLI